VIEDPEGEKNTRRVGGGWIVLAFSSFSLG